jgi:hypothetical protein
MDVKTYDYREKKKNLQKEKEFISFLGTKELKESHSVEILV